MTIRPQAIKSLDGDASPRTSDTCRPDDPTLRLSVPTRLQRAGLGLRLLVEEVHNETSGKPDPSMLRLIAMAHRFRTMLMQQQASTLAELAEQAGISPSYFSRVLRLSFLSPEIVKAVLHGAQPPQITAKRLMGHATLPRGWSEQARQLGFG